MTDRDELVSHDAADLERRLAGVLDVAERVVTVLAPGGYRAAGDPDPGASGGTSADAPGAGRLRAAEPAVDVSAEKVITETAILVLAATRVAAGRPAIAGRADRLARRLAPYARSERVRALMALEPVVALEHGSAHLCLASAGYPAPGCDRLLRALELTDVAPGGLPGRERTPCRQLEQLWLRTLLCAAPSDAAAADRCGGASGRPIAGLRPALASSMLGRQLDVLSGTRAEAYAITHAAMFATDFGTRPVWLPRPRAAVLADLEGALAASLDGNDYDVAGELLACWPMLGLPWTPAAALGFRVLAAAQDDAGLLPTPLPIPERSRLLDAIGRAGYALAATYHGDYVMGLLCSTLLDHGPPPAAVPISHQAAAAARELAGYLDDRPVRWREHFRGLAPQQQAGLAPFILAVTLRQAVTDRRLGQVACLLGEAARWGLLDGPAPQQAAQLLKRVVILAADSGADHGQRLARVPGPATRLGVG